MGGNFMPFTKAKAEGNKRHVAQLDNIMIRPYKAEGERIRAAAAAAGKSLQGFILDAVRQQLPPEPAEPDTTPEP